MLLWTTLGLAIYPTLTAFTNRVELIVVYATLAGLFQAGLDLVFFDELMKTVPPEYSATFVSLAQSLQYVSMVASPLVGLPYVVLARKDVKRPADLKGKSIGVTRPGDFTYKLAKDFLKKHNLSEKDVTLATVGGTPTGGTEGRRRGGGRVSRCAEGVHALARPEQRRRGEGRAVRSGSTGSPRAVFEVRSS